jgi:acyl carrier protein phosphodiesterase
MIRGYHQIRNDQILT